MKNKLQFMLPGIMVLVLTFSGCQKQSELAPPSAISATESKTENNGESRRVGHTFNAMFTKWINDYPFMTGIVGGDVGTGTYSGEVLNLSTVGFITSVEALYHFNGRVHQFTAHVFVTENDAPGVGTATITGRVTEGWLKDAHLTGEYKVWAVCPIPTLVNQEGTQCYQGVLHIQVPKGDRD